MRKAPPRRAASRVGPVSLEPFEFPELVFGLVGAVGTDLDAVSAELTEELAKVGYQTIKVKVSTLLYGLDRYRHLDGQPFESDFDRISAHMDAGTQARRRSKRGDVLAMLSVAAIQSHRRQHWGTKSGRLQPIPKTAYILQSLKHPDEVATLRDVYGRAFFLVSTYAAKAERCTRLASRIARSRHDSDESKYRDQAEQLLQRDEQEDRALGQNVRAAFPMADVFVKDWPQADLRSRLCRFVEIVFSNPFHTPTRDEVAMFHAQAASLRSADLSRQVGAAIASPEGDIISVGCNDVPRAGGGLYWPGDIMDARDFQLGYDANSKYKQELLAQLIDHLRDIGYLSPQVARRGAREISDELAANARIAESIAANVIEFGRAVHAEMAAIVDAARRGVSLRGATLYTTTFPCHLCARHIVAAGLKDVVYVEPYPKSVAGKLYPDSIELDAEAGVECGDRVGFRPFAGVAPLAYEQAFRPARSRKGAGGTVNPWRAKTAKPKLRRFVLSYLAIEDRVVGEVLPNVLRRAGIRALS
jgi:cytidine deaminase